MTHVATEELLATEPEQWSGLTELGRTPYLSWEWLSSWCEVFAGAAKPVCLAAHDRDGELRGVAVALARGGRLRSPTNSHSGDWDVLAADDEARAALWAALGGVGARRMRLGYVPGDSPGLGASLDLLGDAGYRVVVEQMLLSPYLDLPETWDVLEASLSRKLRKQVSKSRRGLAALGELEFEVVREDDGIDELVAEFIALEGSGWKGHQGTAIAGDPRLERLYRRFARLAAERGRLRLYRLTLDGRLIAADLGYMVGGRGFGLKTAFDERLSRHSPGTLLQAEVLRDLIGEGADGYDFLGAADPYKMRWAGRLRPRLAVRAYAGARALPAWLWRAHLRPLAKAGRDLGRRRLSRIRG